MPLQLMLKTITLLIFELDLSNFVSLGYLKSQKVDNYFNIPKNAINFRKQNTNKSESW